VTGLGFAGVGWLGESLIAELPKSPGLHLAAIQDVNVDLAAQVAARHASLWYGANYDDMLQLATVDAVVICTPNALHVPQAQAALRAEKHVLVQKPLALSQRDAEKTIAVASECQRLLFVDYTYRFLDTVQALREQVGRPTRITASFHNIYGPGSEKAWFFDSKLSGGGALIDLGVHLLDLALWLVQPSSVGLDHIAFDAQPIDHAATLAARLDDIPCTLEVSWNAPRPRTHISFEVDSPAGSVRWENVDGSFFHFRTLRDGNVLADKETTLREDTLRAFQSALAGGEAPPIDARVYGLLDQAYARR
jgi:predicted dehydrogenase